MKRIAVGMVLSVFVFVTMWAFIWFLERHQAATRYVILGIYALLTGFGGTLMIQHDLDAQRVEKRTPTPCPSGPSSGTTPKEAPRQGSTETLQQHIEMQRDHIRLLKFLLTSALSLLALLVGMGFFSFLRK